MLKLNEHSFESIQRYTALLMWATLLLGSATKAKQQLDWSPETTFQVTFPSQIWTLEEDEC